MVHSRLARLIRIVTEIKTNPRHTLREILETLSISKAQFYKDKEELKKFGFDFRYDRSEGRFEVLADPLIPIYNMTLSELFALTMAVRQLSAAGDYILTYEALQGIQRVISEAPLEVREILRASLDDVVLQEGFGCDPQILGDLQRAVAESRRVIIHYLSYELGEQRYTVDPHQIYFKRRALYMDAYCVEEKEFRVYRLNRVKSVRLTRVTMPRRSGYSFARRHQGSFSVFVGEALRKIKVRFNRRLAPYIREARWHPSQRITDLPDGGIVFEVEVNEPKEVVWWAMQWGAEAEVLEPEDMRALAAGTARRMVRVYERGAKIEASTQSTQG